MRRYSTYVRIIPLLLLASLPQPTNAEDGPNHVSCWGQLVDLPNYDPYPQADVMQLGNIATDGSDNGSQYCPNVPFPNVGFAAIAAGANHSLALRFDGSIAAWGYSFYGQTNVPDPNSDFVAIAGGSDHSLGLKSDGRIITWGSNQFGQLDVPDPNANFVAIGSGGYHSLGIKADGSIVAWGDNDHGQCNIPSPNSGFVDVVAGSGHTIGLKADGTVVVWGELYLGDDGRGDLDLGTDNIAIAAGRGHNLVLKADGSIVAWGFNNNGQCDVPAPNTNFLKIAAGTYQSFALKANGSIVAWGANYYGQCDVPTPNLGFTAIAGGFGHSLAIKQCAVMDADCDGDPDGPVFYVDATATGLNTGGSWLNAKTSIQAAIDAVPPDRVIWVAAGTYDERIVLRDGVQLYGGFAGDEHPDDFDLADRDFITNETLLRSTLPGPVVTVPSGATPTTRIDGFTVTHGPATPGGEVPSGPGLHAHFSSPTIANNRFVNNEALLGGGLFLESSSAIVVRNTLSGNFAFADHGGAIYVSDGSATITECVIQYNTAVNTGGGIYVNRASPAIANNLIEHNTARFGGGIGFHSQSEGSVVGNRIARNIASASGGGINLSSAGSPTLLIAYNTIQANAARGGGGLSFSYGLALVANNRIEGNTATQGGGLTLSRSSPPIINNSIVANRATYGGAMIVSATGGVVANTIFAFNSSGISSAAISGAPVPAFFNNCFHANTFYDFLSAPNPIGTNQNFAADPNFAANPHAGPDGTWGTADDYFGDLRLLDGSPCIDVGDNSRVQGDVDVNGDPRIIDGDDDGNAIVDLGAYEYPSGGIVGDLDTDGFADAIDNCPAVPNPDQLDTDADGAGDACDNCVLANPGQTDCQPNGIGDVCDVSASTSRDCNTNSLPDECENCADLNGDGLVNDADYQLFRATLGRSAADPLFNPCADYDLSGAVGITDFQTFLGCFRASPPIPAIAAADEAESSGPKPRPTIMEGQTPIAAPQ